MEYGLWNLPAGFWAGGNSAGAPPEIVGRPFYGSVNTSAQSQIYHSSGVGVDTMTNFPSAASPPLPRPSFRNQAEYLASLKGTMALQSRSSMQLSLSGLHDDRSQPVSQHILPMNQDLLVEQSSMESVSSSQHPVPMQLPTMIEHHQSQHTHSPLQMKKTKYKRRLSESPNGDNEDDDEDSDWEQNNNSADGVGTNVPHMNVKTEHNRNNGGSQPVDYLAQGFQQQMFNMTYNRMPHIKRGISDEEEEDESDELSNINPVQQIDNYSTLESRSPVLNTNQNTSSPGGDTLINPPRLGYECGECGLVADTRPGLKKHISVSHPAPNPDPGITNALLLKMSTTAACPMASCRFRTTERDEMDAHMARHVAEGFSPNGKKRTGPVSLQRVRYEREEYRCQMCAYSCTIEKAFYKHLKVHTLGLQSNQVKISCVICGKDRTTEVDMNKHMRKHRDNRYFCCDICIFKTVQLKKLIQHRRMHTGEKPHLCPHCAYRSARRDNLRSHVRRVHKKENLYCDTFSPRGLLLAASVSSNTSQDAPSPTPSAPQQQTATAEPE